MRQMLPNLFLDILPSLHTIKVPSFSLEKLLKFVSPMKCIVKNELEKKKSSFRKWGLTYPSVVYGIFHANPPFLHQLAKSGDKKLLVHIPVMEFRTSRKILPLLDSKFSHSSTAEPNTAKGFDTFCKSFCANMETNIIHLRPNVSRVPSGQSTNFLFPMSLENNIFTTSCKLASSGFRSI